MQTDLGELTDRQIRKEIKKALANFEHLDSLDPATVLAEGEADETLAAMDRANARIVAATKQLGLRRHEEWIASGPARAAYRDHERESQERRKRLKPLREAVSIAQRQFAHPELAGQHLDATRLRDEEARELRNLAAARLAWSRSFGTDDELPPPSEEAETRYFELLGLLCGDADLFPRKRRERAIAERREAVAEAERVAALPDGGAAVLPGVAWELTRQPDGLTPAELGALALCALAFANEATPFANSTYQAGEIVISSGQPEMRGNHAMAESGHVRLRDALTVLALNGLVEIERRGIELRIRPGPLLRQEGGDCNGQPAQ